ncbi:flagellar biosynthesis protein FlhB, partial [Lactiplantibacillus pentosus]
MDQFPNFKLFIDKYLPWLAVIGFVVTVSANGNVWLYFMAELIVFVVIAIID